jgi:hypothetical protein
MHDIRLGLLYTKAYFLILRIGFQMLYGGLLFLLFLPHGRS